jgi:REP element-mobilizing transposase RayT
MENNVHNRRSIRLKHYDYSRKGYYFITICTCQHQLLFGKIIDDKMILNDFGKIVNIYWRKQETDIIKPLEHIVVPNHFHSIVEIISAVDENREIVEDEKMLQIRKMMLPEDRGRRQRDGSSG